MPQKTITPPRGWKAFFWRLPIWIYRLKLGFLLGDRFLLLMHKGRKTGLTRYAVVEVIRHDVETHRYIVASGFGERSDWFRNIMRTPEVVIQVGNCRYAAIARRLSPDEGEAELRDYARRHPTALRELSRLIGYEYDGSEESLRRMADQIPVIAFEYQE